MSAAPVHPGVSFGKSKRLIRSADFARVRTEGRTIRGNLMMLGIMSGNDAQSFRAGFVTSRRVGGAVVRNRIRRRLRDIVRLHQRQLPQDLWLVTIARSGAARASYQELRDEWLRLAKRASILAP
ncbi:MAG: ribonuclease P protein component [Verrucomicrobiota bacterium]